MINRSILVVFSFLLIVGTVFGGMTFLYFALPSPKAAASIELPAMVEDDPSIVAEAKEEEENDTVITYLADVYQSLTLRAEPDSNAAELVSLTPMTHMSLIEFVDNTNYAYVEVTSGEYMGYKGYVNTDYITRLGENTMRVGEEW